MSDKDWKNYVNVLFVHYITRLGSFSRWSGEDPREGGVIVPNSISPDLLVCRYLCDNGGRAVKLVEVYN